MPVIWKRHNGKQVWQHNESSAHRHHTTWAMHSRFSPIHIPSITHIHEARVNEYKIWFGCILSTKHKNTLQMWAKRKREPNFKRETKSMNQIYQAMKLFFYSLSLDSFVLLVIYKNIYRGSFDCVGVEINAPQKKRMIFFFQFIFDGHFYGMKNCTLALERKSTHIFKYSHWKPIECHRHWQTSCLLHFPRLANLEIF